MLSLTFFLLYYQLKAVLFCASVFFREKCQIKMCMGLERDVQESKLDFEKYKWVIAIKLSTSEAHSILSYIAARDHRQASTAIAARTIRNI